MRGRRRRGLSALPFLVVLGLAIPSAGEAPVEPRALPGSDTTATTVILVRHAEKLPHLPRGDAGLGVKGMLRARVLARALGEAGIAAVYASQFPRARLTAEPLAEAIGDSVRTYDANDLEALARRILAENHGQTVLVIGHSDSVPLTFEALTGQRLPENESVDYDKLYVVSLAPGGRYRLLRLRYGAGSE